MAVRETLEFDLRGALAQVATLEKEINDLRKPVNIPIDVKGTAVADIRSIDDRLEDIEEGVSEVNRELSEMELAAGRSVADFSRLASEMGIAEGQARDLAGEILEARNSSVRVAEAAKEVARQMGLSEDEANRFADQVGKAATKVDQLDAAATRTSSGGLAKLGTGLRNALGAALAFVGVREVFSFLNNSVQAFSNLQESSSKATVVFGEFANIVLDFTSKAPEQLGSTQAAALEAAASIGNLFLSIGFGQKAAADMSVELVQLGTDLASFNNISVDEALEKLRSGLVGETEPLRTLGVLLSEAAVLAKGLELGLGGATGKLSEAEKVQARFAIIMEQTATAQGDFARTSDGIANSQRSVTAAFQEFQTKVGGALAPLFSSLLDQAPALIDNLEDLVPSLQAIALALSDIGTIAGPVIGFFVQVQGRVAELQSAAITAVRNLFSATEQGDFGEIVALKLALEDVREAVAAGTKPMAAFGAGVTAITEKTRLTTKALKELADASGASALEQAQALRILLNTPGNATAEELIILRNALTDVEEELRGASEANRDYQFIADTLAASLDKGTEAVLSQTQTLTLLRTEADLLGISLQELLAGGAEKFPELAGLIGSLTPATLELATAQDNLATFADSFENTNIRISDAIDEFGKLPDKLKISKAKFLANLTISAAEEAEFQANLIDLFLIAPALATKLQQEGPATRDLVKQYLDDATAAREVEALLTGNAEEITGIFTDQVAESMAASDLDVAGVEALRKFLEGFGNTLIAEEGVAGLESLLRRLIARMQFPIDSSQFVFGGSGGPGGTFTGVGIVPTSTVNVTNNIYNPVANDLPTNIAQANQSTAIAGTLLNKVAAT